MKVAIIGAGICGISCALELERNGIVPDIYERDFFSGWVWPSVSFWPNVFYNVYGNPREYLLKQYKVDFIPSAEIHNVTMKSQNNKAIIKGNLGLIMSRGTYEHTIDNQIRKQLTQTAIYYNSKADYKELAQKYDYVVVASGRDSEARELGVWEEEGTVTIVGALVNGAFDTDSVEIYFNTEYAGTGYGRLTPMNISSAIIGLYIIGDHDELDAMKYFQNFIRKEGLDNFEHVFRHMPPVFTNGRVSKFRIDNIFLAGRSAGLVERTLGCGGLEAMASGTLAARAISTGEDYDSMVKPLQDHVENISSYRKVINSYTNEDFDTLVSVINTPGVKQLLYNTGISFTDMAGSVLRSMHDP